MNNRDNELEVIKQAMFADIDTAMKLLTTITPREEIVMRARLGFRPYNKPMKHSEIAEKYSDIFDSYQRVVAVERKAWRKLRHPARTRKLFRVLLAPTIELNEPLASIKHVSPELMQHLKHEHYDMAKVPSQVFEEIVAELLSGMGWKEVHLVGRSSETSADILAGHFLPDGTTPIKIFIEVKRWKDKIGVEVFNQVLGAMVSERDKFGWHQAWIIALGGAADTRKFSPKEWRAKGLEIKDKKDLISWLDDYKPNKNGLWLPPDILEA